MNNDSNISTPSPARAAGFSRFTKHILLGALFGGLLSSIPLLNCLNFFFCLLNIAGVTLALMMYFKANPTDTMSNAEGALFGAAAGAGAGLISSIFSLILGAMFAGVMAALAQRLPPELARQFAIQGTVGLFMIPVNIVLYAGFGALGGFLSLLLFFKRNLRN